MNFKKTKISFGFFIVFVSISIGALNYFLARDQSNSQTYALPKQATSKNPVFKCYDNFYGDPKQILSVKDEKYIYYQIVAQPKKANTKDEIEFLYFRTSNYRCENLSRDKQGTGRLAFMPKNVAVKLAEQWFKPAFDNCIKSKTDIKSARQACIKQYEEEVNRPPNINEESPQFLFTEDAIALNKLGIKTDKALVVDTYADFRKYMSKFRGPSIKPEK